MKLTLWDKILYLFSIKTTFEWCLVGSTGFGRHSWTVSKEKCRNGTPIIAGGFLDVIKVSTEENARKLLVECKVIANEYNKKHGYWLDEPET
jgi:hypothetical protein